VSLSLRAVIYNIYIYIYMHGIRVYIVDTKAY